MQERPRRGLGARLAGHFDEHRATVIQRSVQGRPEIGWSGCSICRRTKALRELDEVRICQTLADEATVESCFLIAQNVAEAAIVKYDGDEIDLILHRRSKFLNAKHETTITTHANDHLVRVGRLYSQCGHEAEAEIVLIPTADIGARRVNGQRKASGKPDLANFLDEEPIARERLTNDVQIGDLRLNRLVVHARLRLERRDFGHS